VTRSTGGTARSLLAAAVLSGLTIGAGSATAAPPSKSRSCGQVTVKFKPDGEGQAARILATRTSCTRARQVARACLRGSSKGWTVMTEPRDDRDYDYSRTIMDRAHARVSFEVVGGGGCAP
jgi:hypothetical protein